MTGTVLAGGMTPEGDQFRIAVALTALKFKPPNQSFQSYALNLRSKFSPTSPDVSSVQPWKNLALTLERDFAALKEKYEAEQIKLSVMERATMSIPSLPAPNSSLEPSISSKKKPKKKIAPTTGSENSRRPEMSLVRPDLRTLMEDMSSSKEVLLPGTSHSMFSILDDFTRLTSLPEAQLDLILSVTLRTVEAVARQIRSIILRADICAVPDADTLERLGLTLHHVLALSLPPLAQVLPQTAEPMIAFLDRTTRLVLVPLIHAFKTRSETYLGSLFLTCPRTARFATVDKQKPPAASNQSPPIDMRVGMLDLFRKIFSTVDGRLQASSPLTEPSLISKTFRASLILETIRELDHILTVPESGFSRDASRGVGVHAKRDHRLIRFDRVKKLATKDSLWYLCTVLHVLFGEPSSHSELAQHMVTVSVVTELRGTENTCKEVGNKVPQVNDSIIQEDGVRLLSKGISDALLQLITRYQRLSSSPLRTTKSEVGVEASRLADQPDIEVSPRRNTCSGARRGYAIEGRGKAGIRDEVDGETCRDELMLRERSDVGADVNSIDLDVSAAGQLRNDSGSDQCTDSVPQACNLRDQSRHVGTIELDSVGYEMLLGVLERYWVWSRTWDL